MESGKEFTMDEDWLVFHPNPRTPSFKPPEGAVDAHCHVFGPGHLFPFAAERKYTPCDASKDQLWALRDHLGFSRNVIVQATCHGADNRALVDALQHSNDTSRGVATVKATITDNELQELHLAGVRGIRFNFVKRLVSTRPTAALQELSQRIAHLGWHVVLYFEAEDINELAPIIGNPDVSQNIHGAAFGEFIHLMQSNEHVWTKVSCPERLTKLSSEVIASHGYSDVAPFARLLVEQFSERVLWGTDWPHPNMKSHIPDDGQLVDYIPLIAPTPELQRLLLVDNPERLYWP